MMLKIFILLSFLGARVSLSEAPLPAKDNKRVSEIASKWMEVRDDGPKVGSVDPTSGEVQCGGFWGRDCKRLARQVYRALLQTDNLLLSCKQDIEKSKSK